MKKKWIAVFDSGIGGLPVLKKCVEKYNYNFVYFMDNLFCPYGEKTREEILCRIKKCVAYLNSNFDLKALVLACNTATSIAIDEIRKESTYPIIGMEPPLKLALSDNKKNILVISTPHTNKNSKVLKKYLPDPRVQVLSFPHLAKDIEDNYFDMNELKRIISHLFVHEQKQQTDSIVLGCSHFQFVEKIIKEEFNKSVITYKSDDGVVARVNELLDKKDCDTEKGRIAIVQTKYDGKQIDICRNYLLN